MEEFEGLCDEVYQIVVPYHQRHFSRHLQLTEPACGPQEHTYLLMRQQALASNMGVSPDLMTRAQAQDKQAYLQAIETLQQHIKSAAQLRHAFLDEQSSAASE